MAAILGLDDEAVQVACEVAAQGQVVEAVNFNAPNQVVIAGHEAAVERAMVEAKVAGAKRAIRLPVSAPFHSSLIKPAAEVLAQALAQVNIEAPTVPVIHNVDVLTHQTSDEIQAALVSQAWHAVQWVRTVQAMRNAGITHIIECGPGKVLAGLVKRIDPDLIGLSVADPESLHHALDVLSA
jgi:[acyl-carrier-protein] S-malonyltransferase